MQKPIVTTVVLVAAIGAIWWLSQRQPDADTTATPVVLPTLTGDAALGQPLFVASCAACHGKDAGGVAGTGPSLIHNIYRPGHHSDITILLAVRNGVRRHHWRFDSMLPVDGLSDDDVAKITEFVRAVQRENGVQ